MRKISSNGSKHNGRRWVTVKVDPQTKRLLDLVALVEQKTQADLQDDLALLRWRQVKTTLP